MIIVCSLSGYESDIQGKAYIVSLAPFTSITPTFEEAKKHIQMKLFWHGPFGSSTQSLKLDKLVICGFCKSMWMFLVVELE